jgi:plasmid stability protein
MASTMDREGRGTNEEARALLLARVLGEGFRRSVEVCARSRRISIHRLRAPVLEELRSEATLEVLHARLIPADATSRERIFLRFLGRSLYRIVERERRRTRRETSLDPLLPGRGREPFEIFELPSCADSAVRDLASALLRGEGVRRTRSANFLGLARAIGVPRRGVGPALARLVSMLAGERFLARARFLLSGPPSDPRALSLERILVHPGAPPEVRRIAILRRASRRRAQCSPSQIP